jgi:hypothetical protein
MNLSLIKLATCSMEAVEETFSTSSTSLLFPPIFSSDPLSANQALIDVKSVGLPWVCNINAVL